MAWEEHGLKSTKDFHSWRNRNPLEKKEDSLLGKAMPRQTKRSSDNQVNKASSNQWKVTRKLQQVEGVIRPY